MSVIELKNAFVSSVAGAINLSDMFAVTTDNSNPTYLVLTLLDRNEYTAGASGATGTLTGNGHTLQLSAISSDGRGTGIVFTWQAATGRYYNSTYGYFDQLVYNASGSLNDMTTLSVFGTGNLSQANAYATNAYYMMELDPSGYLGTATVVTQPGFTASVPSQATPDSIAAAAESFVGHAWNMDGCWVLASTIAADSGASLPAQSTLIGLAGQANGEWIVAFNGPAGQTGNWQSVVTAGEMIVIGTPGGGGHITTCVSGSGSSAMLVDNITYVNSSGQITNPANDGSSSDVAIAAPHAASQEWSGVLASSVVIYELDAPVVTASVTTETLGCLASQSLGSLFSATDPASKSITEWQVYNTAASDALTMGGTTYQDHTASGALTAFSLASVGLLAGSVATSDSLDVRAYNGSYWGDWQALNVIVAPAAPSAPVLEAQTANQTWTGGTAVSFRLAAGTFQDPQNQALGYQASLTGGQPLPSWLTFNATTGTFSGTAPNAAASLFITVTATDTRGLSATDSFSVVVLGTPQVSTHTPNQTWIGGSTISLTLPANTFVDPQGQTLSYTATQSNGQALPTWLTFNPTTDTFAGTAPQTASTLSLSVTATDTSGLTGTESFTATVQPQVTPAPRLAVVKPSVRVTDPTSGQTWSDGTTVNLKLPANTFTDALGLKMNFIAYQVSGPNVTTWLRFNPTTDTLLGTVPTTASGTVGLGVIAYDSGGMFATDLFSVTLAPAPGHAQSGAVTGADPTSTMPHSWPALSFQS